MARKLSVVYAGAGYPWRNRGDRREAIFRDDADREALLAAPAEACAKTARRRCQPPPDSLKKINMTLSRTAPFTGVAGRRPRDRPLDPRTPSPPPSHPCPSAKSVVNLPTFFGAL